MWQIEIAASGRWQAIGGKFETEEAAQSKIEQYRLAGSKKAPLKFRLRWE